MGCGASNAAPDRLSKEPVTVDLGTLQADDAIDPGDDIGKAAAITHLLLFSASRRCSKGEPLFPLNYAFVSPAHGFLFAS